MIRRCTKQIGCGAALAVALSLTQPVQARTFAEKQLSLAEWRTLTAPTNDPPRVFVKADNARFYFRSPAGVEGFKADWNRLRVPSPDYRVNSALLRWESRLPRMPSPESSWREARVIAGVQWQKLSTALVDALAPSEPGHAAYYQTFLADGVLYRDSQGMSRLAPREDAPPGLIIDERYSIDETLEFLAQGIEKQLGELYPGEDLFLIMASDPKRFPQPLLLKRAEKQCVWFAPEALYDAGESHLVGTAQNIGALVFESHGLALVKNPVSSLFRLGDLGVQTAVRFLRRPLPRTRPELGPTGRNPGMDLAGWEKWLDRYTGTRRQAGSTDLLLDGDRFFPRLKKALGAATNHIRINMYIFDRDDVAVEIADLLKAKSRDLDVKVVMDRMGTLGAGILPPSTPLPEKFVCPPGTIGAYLERDSKVDVRWFLNPWFSSDHSKLLLVDGHLAWVGGMNIGREYRYEWHDLMVELRGPIAARAEEEFAAIWAHAGPLGDAAYLANAIASPKGSVPGAEGSDGPKHLRWLPTKTAWKPFATAVLSSLRKARNHIYVEHPYLFDKRVLIAMVQARKRGVDVRVVLPRVNDFKLGARSNLVTANYLLANGVRVYFYPGMTHVKALLVDGWACVGSANLNHMSMRLCQEQNVATSDPAFAEQLRTELFEKDFERSYELDRPLAVGWTDFLVDLALESF